MWEPDVALKSESWTWREARKILKRANSDQGVITFQTGFGPSGLPHIGTFSEVLRTTMVMQAFTSLAPERDTRLIVFSDDMDGLRKIPDNIPQNHLLEKHLGMPLNTVPDPYSTDKSFAHHNNRKLKEFLDSFGFQYQFQSSSELYKSGFFDEFLIRVLQKYEDILNILLPTLGKERRSSYSPFMPISLTTGKVLQVAVKKESSASVSYIDEFTGKEVCVPVTGGHCKLQWKVDWAMRWAALNVHYEMSGKDLRESFLLSSKICEIIGGQPPEGFIYEMFLDEDGSKISKSKGNGLGVEEWLKYGTQESLAFYMHKNPSSAKRLSFDLIPRVMDDYLTALKNYPNQSIKLKLGNPVWHIHKKKPPDHPGVSFGLLLSIATTCNAENQEILWGFVERYKKVDRSNPLLREMILGALNYYKDKVIPTKKYKLPTSEEKAAMKELRDMLMALDKNTEEEEIQSCFYQVGRNHSYQNLRLWFRVLYQVLMGQDSGPRWASFVCIYGINNFVNLIDEKINQNSKICSQE